MVGKLNGGERGIRTLGTTFGGTRDFQSRSFGQLGHLSVGIISIRRRRRFEPSGRSNPARPFGGEGGAQKDLRPRIAGFFNAPDSLLGFLQVFLNTEEKSSITESEVLDLFWTGDRE